MTYNIISTGSKGNAVIINDFLLIDCGVSYKTLQPFVKNIQLVLLTHIHGDHFNKSAIRKLAFERPTVRFACSEWLVDNLLGCGVEKARIDVLEPTQQYDYKIVKVTPERLIHNVPNCGYHLFFGEEKLFYATDTNSLSHIAAENYDLYLVEANYTEESIRERIKRKQEQGLHCYEFDVLENHLSEEKCNDWLYKNMGAKSRYLHIHKHKEEQL